ncbi:hypothetical protein B0T22DRAFT_4528 [Podospora appendiculata]|uniref:Uncharacterized protein n=1 Tax=Podospora appendiculata TaxID=314037 RepID=A0AAE1CEZ3_9PEZI|nr:hypothetical protein B0T22DRAFT_4528 [Podospora appendiculata]
MAPPPSPRQAAYPRTLGSAMVQGLHTVKGELKQGTRPRQASTPNQQAKRRASVSGPQPPSGSGILSIPRKASRPVSQSQAPARAKKAPLHGPSRSAIPASSSLPAPRSGAQTAEAQRPSKGLTRPAPPETGSRPAPARPSPRVSAVRSSTSAPKSPSPASGNPAHGAPSPVPQTPAKSSTPPPPMSTELLRPVPMFSPESPCLAPRSRASSRAPPSPRQALRQMLPPPFPHALVGIPGASPSTPQQVAFSPQTPHRNIGWHSAHGLRGLPTTQDLFPPLGHHMPHQSPRQGGMPWQAHCIPSQPPFHGFRPLDMDAALTSLAERQMQISPAQMMQYAYPGQMQAPPPAGLSPQKRQHILASQLLQLPPDQRYADIPSLMEISDMRRRAG